MKVVNIVGARPQFVKYFAMANALKKRKIKDILIHTGQHYDYLLSKIFFDELHIKRPDYNLGVGSRERIEQIAKMARFSFSLW